MKLKEINEFLKNKKFFVEHDGGYSYTYTIRKVEIPQDNDFYRIWHYKVMHIPSEFNFVDISVEDIDDFMKYKEVCNSWENPDGWIRYQLLK